ncbi:response regulator, partial [Pseudomonas frederiksbergensis]|nr:response regulator [Pseudomonas frederiksbergensis]
MAQTPQPLLVVEDDAIVRMLTV